MGSLCYFGERTVIIEGHLSGTIFDVFDHFLINIFDRFFKFSFDIFLDKNGFRELIFDKIDGAPLTKKS